MNEFPNKPIRGDSFWIVIYEHRPAVIRIAPDQSGFFATGQEQLWPLDQVSAWIREITLIEQQAKAELWTLESVKRLYWKSGLGGIADAHNAAIGVKPVKTIGGGGGGGKSK